MNLHQLNRWLVLAANIGILASILERGTSRHPDAEQNGLLRFALRSSNRLGRYACSRPEAVITLLRVGRTAYDPKRPLA